MLLQTDYRLSLYNHILGAIALYYFTKGEIDEKYFHITLCDVFTIHHYEIHCMPKRSRVMVRMA